MTQSSLKRLAMGSMLCDHTAKVVLSTDVLQTVLGMAANQWLLTLMEVFGRLAFPIFAWFVAEGCRKTGNFPKYLARMTIFAVLSEAPFQLCFYRTGEYGLRFGCHNVMFTLLLAAAGIYVANTLLAHGVPELAATLVPGIMAAELGGMLQTDYNAWGVALVLMLYYLPGNRQRLILLGGWMTVFMLFWHGWDGQTLLWLHRSGYKLLIQWLGGLCAVPFLATYQGKQGRSSKWVFYCFYPVHLLTLYGIRCVI